MNLRMSRNDLPIRDFKLAILYGTVWILLLWGIGHPMDEWAVTVVCLYAVMWASKEVVFGVLLLTLRRLVRQARRVADRLDIDVAENRPAKHGRGGLLFLGVVLVLIVATVTGASLVFGVPIMGMLGFTPLPSYFSWGGWSLFGIGLVGLSLVLGSTALVFARVEHLLDGKGVIRDHALTESMVPRVSPWTTLGVVRTHTLTENMAPSTRKIAAS